MTCWDEDALDDLAVWGPSDAQPLWWAPLLLRHTVSAGEVTGERTAVMIVGTGARIAGTAGSDGR